jgi:hypothetical protein
MIRLQNPETAFFIQKSWKGNVPLPVSIVGRNIITEVETI